MRSLDHCDYHLKGHYHIHRRGHCAQAHIVEHVGPSCGDVGLADGQIDSIEECAS
jgi:hypothetical protein